MLLSQPTRNARMTLNEVYFWTDTIKDWKRLFNQEKYIEVVITSWQELVEVGLVTIYAFVVMPNHFHVVWELRKKKEWKRDASCFFP